jgi:HK97 family phage portal protein
MSRRKTRAQRKAGTAVAVRKDAVPRAFEQPGSGGWHSLTWGRPETDFQRDIRWTRDSVLANETVYACISLIASDCGKVALDLVEKVGKIWVEAESAAFSPVLRKPNHYQTRQQFVECWITSKLAHGNTYVLKERDRGGVVRSLYILDPCRVRVMVADSGAVFYDLSGDDLAHVPDFERTMVPASEIIHDRMICLFHPLIGVSPIYACGLAASQATAIQRNSAHFFANGSRPGVVLSAPGQISDPTAQRVKEHWEREFSGDNVGRVAVLGDDLKPVTLAFNPEVSQLVEQLGVTAERICSTFHVPGFKVGVGAAPTYQNAAVLNQVYYTDCLQKFTEAIEALLDEGLGLTERKEGHLYGTMFRLDDLIKMDPAAYATMLGTLVDKTIMAPNEARSRMNLPDVDGGEQPLSQQQYWSLKLLADRKLPPDTPTPAAAPVEPPEPAEPPEDPEKTAALFTRALLGKMMAELNNG